MDFAPYQDTPPETTRALSPPPTTARPTSPRRPFSPSQAGRPDRAPPHPDLASPASDAIVSGEDWDAEAGAGRSGSAGVGVGFGGRREDVDMFQTRLGLRMDYEACLAYLLLPPAGAVFLLIIEHQSDYVRFHAWQSSLLFSLLFIIHIILSWSSVLSWLLFTCDMVLIAFLTFRAYKDADTLDRCEIPFFGPLASQILDDE